jgi:hypothetical protein
MKKLLMISVSALALSAGAAFATDQVTDITASYDTLKIAPNIAAPAGAPQADTNVTVGAASSTIDQIGDANTVGDATNYGAKQHVIDGDSGAKSVIRQGSAASGQNKSYNATASVTQEVSGKGFATSLINQDSTGGGTSSVGNTATVTQIIDGGTKASASTINQSGEGLSATISQGVSGTAVSNVSSYIGQGGTGGTVNVEQQASGASSVVLQDGKAGATLPSGFDYNVNVLQANGVGHFSGVDQSGDLGAITVIHRGYPNTTSIDQKGDYDSAKVTQIGEHNQVKITQHGNHDTAIVQQSGNNLNAQINQFGRC